ncbi:glutamate--cysteine ligase [Streptomyces sp. NPDC051569]|uniref:glutamate--cysteine ligase n=1 Tax=Streptomyces sp. NPDC051569 TaxID=3365661 RepID=UPI0037BB9915
MGQKPVMRPTAFTGGAPASSLTMGVEEEFQLVHSVTGAPDARGPAVLAHAARQRTSSAEDGTSLHQEILASMAETTTGVCGDLAEVRRQVTAGRARLAAAAREEGLRPLAVGVHPAPAPPRQVSGTEHYRSMHELYGQLVTETETCGCHVHVGTLDKDDAVTAVNHLRPWLPTLLALSANSRFHNGLDTGYASWRTILLSRWPTNHIPPHFESAAHYEETLASLHRAGVLRPEANAYWLARPSSRLPTVEIRVADVCATVDGAVLQAGLARALVHTALNDTADPPATSDGQLLAAALWTAARHGIGGPAIHPRTGDRIPAAGLVRELFATLRPALRETGDLEEMEQLLADILRDGTGADQRRGSGAGAAPAHESSG